MFQSSSAPKDGCYVNDAVLPGTIDVSILIRPEGRMLREALLACPCAGGVSILIRPEGRMLHGSRST